jgi:hypothetical protein
MAAFRFFAAITAASIGVSAIFQIPAYNWSEDNIHGLFSDAHILGAFVAIIAVGFLSDFIENKRNRSLIIACLLLAYSLYPRNGKVVLLSGLWFALVFIRHYVLPKGRVIRLLFLALLVATAVGGITHLAAQEDSPLRLFQLSEFEIADLGPIAAWPIAVGFLLSSPLIALCGMGAGEYGWLSAFRAVSAGGGSEAAQTFSFEFSLENTRAAGFLFRTNTWSSLLVEFGLIGFTVMITAIGYIAYKVLQSRAKDSFERTALRVFTFTFVVVVFQGFFTPFSNWSESILMFPLMYLAAYFVGRRN